ncbi:Arylsulfatase [Stieleria neptunia]|uniref:Arylsulfatase n=1 Tax=Stieleria neptunia TaxID=2527979 RepID=A0A518HWS6_9BACT|nr:exo-alpha-sialidase [Stieleria neptunia]QDV45315.1 Arylsulfatase [Stieleria neptunia]
MKSPLGHLYVSVWTLCLLSASLAPTTAFSMEPQSVSPNIVLIVADDLGYGDLGCYGQKLIATPNIDRLAQQGIRFTQAYAGGPVCTPSRSVLMTGLHGGHTPARDNIPHYPTYLGDQDRTVAEVLKDAGYRCGGVGKWSLGDAGTVGAATRQGFDEWVGYLNQDHAHYYFTEYLDRGEGRIELPGNPVTKHTYSHDVLTDHALRFIQESKHEPFFLYAAYTLPHFSSKTEDADGLAVPSTDPYSDRDWPEKAKKYAAMVHRLDAGVGRIADQIGALGLAENTLLVFSSDNGGHTAVWDRFETNGPLRGFKRDLTEGGIRVPFIARWPGKIPAASVSDQVIAFQDLLPTFAQIAGGDAPADIDGVSVLDALLGKPLTVQRDYLYWDYGHCRKYYDQAVRLGDWKGIRLGKENGAVRLYDLNRDPGESRDVADDHPAKVDAITRIMETATTPNPRYRVGELYRGSPIWRAENQHLSLLKLPSVSVPGRGAHLRSGFVFDPQDRPTPQCHSSTLAETPDGLVAAWFGGTNEPALDNVIWVARQVDGKWQQPVQVADGSEGETEEHRVGNPVLYQPHDGPLLLFYKVVDPKHGRASHWWGMLMTSDDHGATWSKPHRLGTDAKLGAGNPNLIGPVKNKPIQLADGTILCPSSTEHDGWRVHFEISRDLGKTWQIIGPINDATNFNAIQPSLLVHPGNQLQVLCRSKEGVVAQCWSSDGGETWGPLTATPLPNPNSGTDAVTLADGRHLLVYNHTIKRGPFPAARSMLNVALSTDGKQWNPVLTLEREPGAEFSYPAVIQATDGKVHISYTWKRQSIRHVVLDPDQL